MKWKAPGGSFALSGLILGLILTGLGDAQAQSNVYTLNVVGYVNVSLTNGNNYVANPLDFDGTGTNNTISTVLGTNGPEGMVVFRYDPSTHNYTDGVTLLNGVGWYSPSGKTNDPAFKLNPGEGFVVQVPRSTNVTIVGMVLQGSLANWIPAGYSLRASMVPIAGGLQTTLGFPPVANDVVWRGAPNGRSLTKYTYLGTSTNWSPSEPTLNVGEAFFLQTTTTRWWTYNFVVSLTSGQSTPSLSIVPPPGGDGGGSPAISKLAVRNGTVTLQLAGYIGAAFNVQFSTNRITWQTVATSQSGLVWTGAYPGGTHGYYRITL